MPTADIITSSPRFLPEAPNSSVVITQATHAGIGCVNPARIPDWDVLLARHAHASFFHSAVWAEVLENTYRYTPKYFAVREAGGFSSLLPLMEIDSWLTGRRGVSLPFTDDCEPICADIAVFNKLKESAIELGRARGWKHVEFRGGREFFGDVPASLVFHGHELDLSGSQADLLSRVDGSVRRAIRKAEKEGVIVEVSRTPAAVEMFYQLLCQTRRKHGMPPQPFVFFQQIQKQVLAREMGVVVLASFQGQPVAGGMYFQLGNRAIYKYGASDERQQHLRGNNLVMWEAIKWHARNGCKTLHLGRTSLGNDGLRRFKLNWGATEKPIEYVKYDLRRDKFVTETDGAAGWHNQVFRRLPVSISRKIGERLYPHWG